MNDVVADQFGERLDRQDVINLASKHEGQIAALGSLYTARDGGVNESDTAFRRQFRESFGRVDSCGGEIDGDRALGHVRESAVRTGQDCRHLVRGWEHRADDVGIAYCVSDGLSDFYSILAGTGTCALVEVDAAHGVSGVDEVFGHGDTHVTETDPSDVAHSPLL